MMLIHNLSGVLKTR